MAILTAGAGGAAATTATGYHAGRPTWYNVGMLTMSRHGLGDLTPLEVRSSYPQAQAVLTALMPGLPPALTTAATSTPGAAWGHAPTAATVVPGTVPAQEGRPAPAATLPTATVTSPTGVTESAPVTLPAEPDVTAATPKRWPWVVGGVAAVSALILGARLLRH